MRLNLVKSWSHTWKLWDVDISTCFPLSAATTGVPGSPTLTRCLSSKQWWVPKQYSILTYISEDGSTVVTVHVVLTKLAFLHHHFDEKSLRLLRCCFRSWILRPELKPDPLLRWNSHTLRTSLCDLLHQITNWDCLCHVRYCIMSALMYSSALIQIDLTLLPKHCILVLFVLVQVSQIK